MKNKKAIVVGGALFGVGLLCGIGVSDRVSAKMPVIETSPVAPKIVVQEKIVKERVEVPVIKEVPVASVDEGQAKPTRTPLKNVSAEDMALIKSIMASRGETELPPQEWVDHVLPKIKKSRAAKNSL